MVWAMHIPASPKVTLMLYQHRMNGVMQGDSRPDRKPICVCRLPRHALLGFRASIVMQQVLKHLNRLVAQHGAGRGRPRQALV